MQYYRNTKENFQKNFTENSKEDQYCEDFNKIFDKASMEPWLGDSNFEDRMIDL